MRALPVWVPRLAWALGPDRGMVSSPGFMTAYIIEELPMVSLIIKEINQNALGVASSSSLFNQCQIFFTAKEIRNKTSLY